MVGLQDVAHLDGRKVLDMLARRGVRVIGGVENMAGLVCLHCGEMVEVFSGSRGAVAVGGRGSPASGSLPLDPAVAPATKDGRSSSCPRVWSRTAYRAPAGEVADALEAA